MADEIKQDEDQSDPYPEANNRSVGSKDSSNDGDLGPFENKAAQFASYVARLLSDSRCESVMILDVRKQSQVTNFFVLATATSGRQIQSIAEDIKALAIQEDNGIFAHQGRDAAKWLVVDCFDVVVHLLDEESRSYYDLESLWAEAKHLEWESVTTPGQFANLDRNVDTSEA